MAHSAYSQSTASTLPYDVLSQIFLQCLPSAPLDEVQLNTEIAPMLLCHVSSSWRDVALSMSTLWSHLYYRLPVMWNVDWEPVIWDVKRFRRDMECLTWWRQNVRNRAHFIRFGNYLRGDRGGVFGLGYEKLNLTSDTAEFKFIVQYLSTARYLDVGLFSWFLFGRNDVEACGDLCPHLQTLVARFPEEEEVYPDEDEDENPPIIIPFQIPPTLRQLHVHFDDILENYDASFGSWSVLTHLSLHDVLLSPAMWLSLFRGAINLQWAFFNISLQGPEISDLADTPHIVLPFLSTLSLKITKCGDPASIQWRRPIKLLLKNLRFPVLDNLFLHNESSRAWRHPTAMKEVMVALRRAPRVTALSLGRHFLRNTYKRPFGLSKATGKDQTPLSALAPHLEHVRLDFGCGDFEGASAIREAMQCAYWHHFFFGERWLDLTNPTCSVRRVTIIVSKWDEFKSDSVASSSESDSGEFDSVDDLFQYPWDIKDAVTEVMDKFAEKAPHVVFEAFLDGEYDYLEGWDTHLAK
ncbi:hypothetical protein BDN70DRAFT_876130 [Pholiota conissans]|uniref:F-box domain-containing protein n=1 Tax=Pholiota conissans TaxID=109636 RepID=A0A9P5Z6C8_9AGAR|nr:hypothetical protein BDN70DRAFT_876130 [Pholiota conissans]